MIQETSFHKHKSFDAKFTLNSFSPLPNINQYFTKNQWYLFQNVETKIEIKKERSIGKMPGNNTP